jgi:secreted trypsin-like serine protease
MLSIKIFIFIAIIAHARAAGNETDKIVGGIAASSGEFPGYAIPSFQSGAENLCGAYLIRNDILVTAAHCRIAFEGYDVHIGGTEIDGGDAVETIRTGDVCQHPGFSDSSFSNDIMLIRLRTPSSQQIKDYYTVRHQI